MHLFKLVDGISFIQGLRTQNPSKDALAGHSSESLLFNTESDCGLLRGEITRVLMPTAFAHIRALVLRGRARKFERSIALDLSTVFIERPTTFFSI